MMHILLFFSLSSRCRLFHNAIFFGSCDIHILNTESAKILKKIPAPKGQQTETVCTGFRTGTWTVGSHTSRGKNITRPQSNNKKKTVHKTTYLLSSLSNWSTRVNTCLRWEGKVHYTAQGDRQTNGISGMTKVTVLDRSVRKIPKSES